LLILVATVVNYGLARLVEWAARRGRERGAVALAVVFNIGLLVAFKYANFLADNYNALAAVCGLPVWRLKPVHLPIRISFFTSEALSYVIDVARKQVSAQRSLPKFALYMTLFPHLIAGPVVRYADLADRLGRRRVTLDGFAEGVWRFVIGLGKKTLLAN